MESEQGQVVERRGKVKNKEPGTEDRVISTRNLKKKRKHRALPGGHRVPVVVYGGVDGGRA